MKQKQCDELLCAVALRKIYRAVAPGTPDLELFRDLNLTVEAGEMVAIVGESGSGKSTLLHILAALDYPTDGEVWCGFTHVTGLSQAEASLFRNREIGYIWQFHYLLPEFTALENVALPLLARGVSREEAMRQAATWLDRVGLSGRAVNRSGELSGGEQQRVSIARALVTQPKVLLADEPTGDLDAATADRVFVLLQQLHQDYGLTSLIVTHNTDFAQRCDRVLRLINGQLQPV
jgi:lipoprotein-releasing system ATP-binding protein